jgi:hypothetical protein
VCGPRGRGTVERKLLTTCPTPRPPQSGWRRGSVSPPPASGPLGRSIPGMQLSHHHYRDKVDAQGRPHHQQQELLLLVPARLALVPACRPRLRGEGGVARRPFGARRAAPALAVVSGAVADARGRAGLGYAGDRRVPGRDFSRGWPLAARAGASGALPGHLRGDALGLLQYALGTAHEPQGASPGLQGVGAADPICSAD